jgi:choice-of-anchor C domain-containing protein
MWNVHLPSLAGFVAISFAATAAALAQDDRPSNLIVNGSFEAGPAMESSFLPLDEDSVEIRGWVITRGQIDLLQESDGGQRAAEGKRCLDLHGSPGFGGLKQPFVTRAGQRYRITFSMSGSPGLGYEIVQMFVQVAGKKEMFACSMAGRTLEDLKWETKTCEFTAVDTITVLEFHTAMAPSSNPFGGVYLDNVEVVAVH